MPELPDVLLYIDALERFVQGHPIQRIELRSPFVLRSVDPPVTQAEGETVMGFGRMGKRIVWELEDELYLVFHLMIAGRFHWRKPNAGAKRKTDLIAFRFEHGTLMLTEAGTKKRASLHVVRGKDAVEQHDPRGLEVLDCSLPEFRTALLAENHTLKRSLTDARLFSGIGNAYSDEILHAAGLSPFQWTSRLSDDDAERLYHAVQSTLSDWVERLREDVGEAFPEKVTAFRDDMAVHGRFRKPCPVCGTDVQRIVYAQNETNYCPRCQTGGKVLADRSLSRLLRDDYPRRIEDLETRPGFTDDRAR